MMLLSVSTLATAAVAHAAGHPSHSAPVARHLGQPLRRRARTALAALAEADSDLVIDAYDAFLVDCDGVLWHGAEPIDGSLAAIDALRARGKRLVFVTNNSGKSRRAYADKFAALGARVDASDISTSGSAAAQYVRAELPACEAVFVVGEDGLKEELRGVGLEVHDTHTATAEPSSTSHMPPAALAEAELAAARHELAVGAVVVGQDLSFSFRTLALATLYLTDPRCAFVATNLDPFDLIAGGRRYPGAGSMVSAISTASGREPVAVGKPAPSIARLLLREYGLSADRTCIVGDRLDTDIALAHNAGFDSVLCLSGCTSADELAAAPPAVRPTHVVGAFAELLHLRASGAERTSPR